MSIAAEVQRIRDVFSPGADIRVPPFQRAYAWEDEETEVMIRDLLEAFRAGTIYFLGAIVLFASCINYANLATAQAATRAKEIGMRRVVGARSNQG